MTARNRHDVREISTSLWASVLISEYERVDDTGRRDYSAHVHVRTADEGSDLGHATSDESLGAALRELAAHHRRLADELDTIAAAEEAIVGPKDGSP